MFSKPSFLGKKIFASKLAPIVSPRKRRNRNSFRPLLEILEDRTLLSGGLQPGDLVYSWQSQTVHQWIPFPGGLEGALEPALEGVDLVKPNTGDVNVFTTGPGTLAGGVAVGPQGQILYGTQSFDLSDPAVPSVTSTIHEIGNGTPVPTLPPDTELLSLAVGPNGDLVYSWQSQTVYQWIPFPGGLEGALEPVAEGIDRIDPSTGDVNLLTTGPSTLAGGVAVGPQGQILYGTQSFDLSDPAVPSVTSTIQEIGNGIPVPTLPPDTVLLRLAVVIPAVDTWTGNGSNNLWSNPDNWSGNSAPAAGDELVFPANAAQQTSQDDLALSFNSVTIEGGNYEFSGQSLPITTSLSLKAGSLTLDNAVTVSADATLSDSATLIVSSTGSLDDEGKLTVAANATLDDEGNVTIGANGSLSDQGSVTIGENATLNDQSDLSVAADASLADEGALTVETNATLEDLGILSLAATGSFSANGNVNVAAGANLSLLDQASLQVGAMGSLSNQGTLSVAAGASLSVLDLGTLQVAATGSSSIQGTMNVAAGANLSVLDQASLQVAATGSFSANGNVNVAAGANLSLLDQASLQVGAMGSLSNQGTLSVAAGASLSVLDLGTLQVAATGSSSIQGTMNVAAGANLSVLDQASLQVVATGSFSANGNVNVAAGANLSLLDQASLQVGASASLSDQGRLSVAVGARLSDLGSLSFGIHASLFDQGILTVGVSAKLDIFGLVEITLSGSLSDQGTITVEAFGKLSDKDAVTVATGATLDLIGQLIEGVGGHLDVFGTLIIEPGATLDNFGTVVLQPGATYQPQGNVTVESRSTFVTFHNMLSAVLENAKTAAGPRITSLIKGHVTDADPKAQQGIAVTGLTGNGTWQFSSNGLSWGTIRNVSMDHALLLPTADLLRYIPAANEHGQFELIFLAWDRTTGTAEKYVSIPVTGGASSFSALSGMIVAPVTHVNQAPTWTGTTTYLTPVLPGSYSPSGADPAGDTVAGIFGGFFYDADGTTTGGGGVAIVSATGTTNGTWQYSIDSGTTWTSFGAAATTFKVPSLSNALLLSASDLVRFVPKTGFVGTATVTAYAWDGTQGTAAAAGATKGFTIAARGGTTAFSTALLTARCPVNNSPTLGASTGPILPAATEGVAKTVAVGTLLTDAQAGDPNPKALKGIAIVAMGGSGQWPGTWQYSLNGTSWSSVPAVSESSAFLLPSTASLRFVAAIQADNSTLTEPATLTYRAWDQTAGTSGKLFAVAGTGGAMPISASEVAASMPVNFVNHAPTWLASTFNLTPVLPGDPAPAGNQVADAVAIFQDADGNPIGVAVVAATGTSKGAWEFSTHGGGTWNTPLFAPSLSNALLLPAGDLVRFRPKTGFAGVVTVSAYAWDGTKGTAALAGATKGFAIAARGGSTAFSTALLTVRCAVNNAPTFGTASGPTLPTGAEGVAKTVTVSTLLTGGQVTDPNPGALKGIAVVGMGGTGQWPGSWQYSLNNRSWFSMPAVSDSSAFLLPSTAFVRFMSAIQPNSATQVNPATLTYHAWDQTAGSAGKLFAVTSTGGATPFSATEVTASQPVNLVNHAPTWLVSTVSLTPVPPGTYSLSGAVPAGDAVAEAASIFNDLDGSSVGVAIVSAGGTANGTWQYSTDGGTTWTSFGALTTTFGVPSLSNALLLLATDLIRFVPKTGFVGTATLGAYAWDGTQGTKAAAAGATKGTPITARGGGTPFSAALLTAIILVDTAPVLSA